MEGPHLAALENLVGSLKASPLFNLSLASKELFHSNFLAWLCERYPTLAGPLFARFTKAPCQSCDSLKVYRERHNLDLTIVFPNGESLIVENKVKSIPSLDQLKKYSDNVKDKEHTSFLLLSLIWPSFVPSTNTLIEVNGTPWHILSYSDIVGQMESTIDSISAIDRYHGELLNDYLRFVRSLIATASHFSVDLHYDDADFFMKQERELLREIRLHDLIDKIRYGQLAEKIKETLKSEGCHIVAKDDFFGANRGDFMLDSALYQGEALCEFKCLAKVGDLAVALGVMLQGNAVKVFVEVWPRSLKPGKGPPPPECQATAKRVAEELMSPKAGEKVWFDLTRISSNSPEMPATGRFNQYFGTCFYRYKKIDQSSAKGLVDLLVDYARSIQNAENAIQSQIEAAWEPR